MSSASAPTRRAAHTLQPNTRRVAPLLIALAIITAARAECGEIERLSPFLMRVEGFVGEKPEGITSLARWVVAIDGRQYPFHVTKLQPIGVDIAYWNILNFLEPLPVSLTLYGDPALLQRFTGAPPGTPIAITGNFQAGAGPVSLLLTTVEPLATPSPGNALGTPPAKNN